MQSVKKQFDFCLQYFIELLFEILYLKYQEVNYGISSEQTEVLIYPKKCNYILIFDLSFLLLI